MRRNADEVFTEHGRWGRLLPPELIHHGREVGEWRAVLDEKVMADMTEWIKEKADGASDQ